MKDEELLARKKRLSAILLHRLNRHFYPLACRSFSLDALSIDQAFAGVAAGLSARDRSMVVRMYVHFRLALAEMFLETEAEGSSFLSLTLAGKLSLDVTGQFSKAFRQVLDGLLFFDGESGGWDLAARVTSLSRNGTLAFALSGFLPEGNALLYR